MTGERPGSDAPPPPAGRDLRADIQALRALAVLSVLAYHLWPGAVPGGYVGVDAFFVISGYLITGRLAEEAAAGGISLREFWIRRARRLLPSSILVLAVSALATFLWIERHAWRQTFREIIASAGYVQNWLLAHDAVDYLAAEHRPSIVQHYWTLSMEEQFYVALPLLLLAALRARLPAARSSWLLAAIAVLSFAYSIYLTELNSDRAYFVTTTRAWEFAAGGILATAGWRAPRRLGPPAFWLGIAQIVGSALVFGAATPFPGYLAALPVAGAAMVIWADHRTGLGARLSAARPVQFLGDVSYALYLWHWPLVVLAPRFVGEPTNTQRVAIGALAVLLAGLTTRFVERPVRERPIVASTGRNVLIGSSAGALVVVAMAVVGLRAVHVDRRAMAALSGAAQRADPECFGAAAMTRPCPAATGIVPDPQLAGLDTSNRGECWSNNGEDKLRICSLGPAEGYTRRLFAVGDSHNNALISAYEWVAQTAGWRIDVTGKGGCYLTAARIRKFKPEFDPDCRAWQRKVRAYLRTRGPYDAVLVTHAEAFPLHTNGRPHLEVEIEGLVQEWSGQIARGQTIVAVKDVPVMPPEVVECVRRHGLAAESECATDRESTLRTADSQTEAAKVVDGAHLLNFDDLFCSARCPPVIGGVAVWRDKGHITATFARSLAPFLLAELRPILDGSTARTAPAPSRRRGASPAPPRAGAGGGRRPRARGRRRS